MACSAYATTTSTPTFNGGGGFRRYFPTVAKECHTLRLLSAGVLSLPFEKIFAFSSVSFCFLLYVSSPTEGRPIYVGFFFLFIRLIREIFIEKERENPKNQETKIRADSVYPGPASISTCSAFVIIPLSSTIPFPVAAAPPPMVSNRERRETSDDV
jgi:hypothetical protein